MEDGEYAISWAPSLFLSSLERASLVCLSPAEGLRLPVIRGSLLFPLSQVEERTDIFLASVRQSTQKEPLGFQVILSLSLSSHISMSVYLTPAESRPFPTISGPRVTGSADTSVWTDHR